MTDLILLKFNSFLRKFLSTNPWKRQKTNDFFIRNQKESWDEMC